MRLSVTPRCVEFWQYSSPSVNIQQTFASSYLQVFQQQYYFVLKILPLFACHLFRSQAGAAHLPHPLQLQPVSLGSFIWEFPSPLQLLYLLLCFSISHSPMAYTTLAVAVVAKIACSLPYHLRRVAWLGALNAQPHNTKGM